MDRHIRPQPANFPAAIGGRNLGWQYFQFDPSVAACRRPGHAARVNIARGGTVNCEELPMKTLFLHPPSFDGFDGGAGARYQMKREVRSFWYPTWLAQPAALVEGSKLIDAPPHGLNFDDIVPELKNRELVVMHTSTPSFKSDVKTAEMIKAINPDVKIGFIGAKVAVEPEKSLIAGHAIDFVARNEFDFTIKEVADGMAWSGIKGLSYRNAEGVIVHNEDRAVLENMDSLPWVTPVYKRDLNVEKYFGGYLKHPYISFYTGRGCKSRCTFCLWPQTVGGHRYRVRSVENVVEEMKWAKQAFPQVKEFFFDDDTLTDNLPRVEALAKELGKLGVTWSCNAKANVPRKTLEVMKANGLRLLLVGYESGNQQILINIKKGMRVDFARRFTKDCHELGIVIHGTFILGLPGETRETIQQTLDFAKEINPHTIQISLAAPYPGTFLYRQAKENGWLYNEEIDLLTQEGTQIAPLNYPHLSHTEIFKSVEDFYKKFYFRPSKIASIVAEMIRSPEMMKRRLREGVEFFHFLRSRHDAA
jgi:hopanoid biosynthesis associated radical SAM protein HpnJ